jgi:hypothetical protein
MVIKVLKVLVVQLMVIKAHKVLLVYKDQKVEQVHKVLLDQKEQLQDHKVLLVPMVPEVLLVILAQSEKKVNLH